MDVPGPLGAAYNPGSRAHWISLHPGDPLSALGITLRLAAGVVLIAANAFFVAVEFALTRLAEAGVDEDHERAGLRRAASMVDRLEIHLTGCQLGISASSVILGVVAEPAVTELIRPGMEAVGVQGGALRATSVVVAVIVLNLVHKIWGEQAPTYLGVERPEDVAAKLAPALYWWSRIMRPLIKLGDGLAKSTLRLFGVEITRSWTAGAGTGEGEDGERVRSRSALTRKVGDLLSRSDLPEDRQQEVVRTLEIGEMPVREIMVPREDMVCLALDEPFECVLERIRDGGHTRYPVFESDGGDGFVAILYVPALFRAPGKLTGNGVDLRDHLEPAGRVPVDEEVADLIDILQAASQELFLVQEDDRVVGMVTVTDAFEAIVGELEDPLD